MEGNEGLFDRIVRGVVGAILLAVGGFSIEGPIALVEGAFALIMAVAGGSLLLTGLIGWCPAYALLGIRTCAPRHGTR
ncbi:MAG TPA: DUF2892 domain-containing protein [Pseudolabrys sp.]|nr:DUF2892 domain-containing protein [Pseudolabrys sp.]